MQEFIIYRGGFSEKDNKNHINMICEEVTIGKSNDILR